jgi:hypothetical protein
MRAFPSPLVKNSYIILKMLSALSPDEGAFFSGSDLALLLTSIFFMMIAIISSLDSGLDGLAQSTT